MKFRFKDKRMNRAVNFGDILPQLLEQIDQEKLFTIEALRDTWSQIVGDIISAHSIPDRIFKRTLFISVDHAVYANEIVMMKDALLVRIQDQFAGLDIKNIKSEVKKISWTRK